MVRECRGQQVCSPVTRTEQQCRTEQTCQMVAVPYQQCSTVQNCQMTTQYRQQCSQQQRCANGRCVFVPNCVNVPVSQQVCNPRQVCQQATRQEQRCRPEQRCSPRQVTTQQCGLQQRCEMVARQVFVPDPVQPSHAPRTTLSGGGAMGPALITGSVTPPTTGAGTKVVKLPGSNGTGGSNVLSSPTGPVQPSILGNAANKVQPVLTTDINAGRTPGLGGGLVGGTIKSFGVGKTKVEAGRPTQPVGQPVPVGAGPIKSVSVGAVGATAANVTLNRQALPSPAGLPASTIKNVSVGNTITSQGNSYNPIPAPIAKVVSSMPSQIVAKAALPYAQLSSDAYDTKSVTAKDYTRVSAVEKDSGFSASVFEKSLPNGQKEIVIAYRGTEPTSIKDWVTDIGANYLNPKSAVFSKQYAEAMELYKETRKANPEARIVLTGHSLGGGLASYVSSETGQPAVTFNAARNDYAKVGDRSNQTNFSIVSDVVGDPNTTSFAGSGALPGQSYSLNSSPDQSSAIFGTIRAHSMESVISRIQEAAE